MKSIKDVILEYMKEHGYTGLVGDGCGCGIDNIGICENSISECEFGYACTPDCDRCECECESRGEEIDICYQTEKPRAASAESQPAIIQQAAIQNGEGK